MLVIGVVSVSLAAWMWVISWEAAVAVLVTACLLLAIFVLYTRHRYREIAKLSGYLRQMLAGQYRLDIRDNREGELSILKNELFKVTERLSEHRAYLKRDRERMTDAISDISHQLKTPLTSMQVMIDLLDAPAVPEEKRAEFMHRLQAQVERMEWLITSLLKLSRLDAGAVQFQRETVCLRDVLDLAIQPHLIPMEVRQIELHISGDRDASFHVDRLWTAEAIMNIVKNAVEHTPEGGRIEIILAQNALYTELVIADNGEGVAKEDLPHLFKRFYKGKNAKETSIGIGLALSYSIVAAHEGMIEVQRRDSGGTQFRFKWYRQNEK